MWNKVEYHTYTLLHLIANRDHAVERLGTVGSPESGLRLLLVNDILIEVNVDLRRTAEKQAPGATARKISLALTVFLGG